MSLFERLIPSIIAGFVDIIFFLVVGLLGREGRLSEPTLAALFAAYASARFKTLRDTGSSGGSNASTKNSDRPPVSPDSRRDAGSNRFVAAVLAPVAFALFFGALGCAIGVSTRTAHPNGNRSSTQQVSK